jgi:predicted RNA-binding protein YlxR (DUF448 family)
MIEIKRNASGSRERAAGQRSDESDRSRSRDDRGQGGRVDSRKTDGRKPRSDKRKPRAENRGPRAENRGRPDRGDRPVHERKQHRKGNSEPELKETEPLRTCIVSREQLPADRLIRLSLVDGQLTVEDKGGGRGAYVSIARACLDELDQRALSRAFRQPVHTFDSAEFVARLHRVAYDRVLQTIGLARRMGVGVFGVERIQEHPGAGELLTATDLASRSQAKLDGGTAIATGAELGSAAGMGWLGAVRIPASHLAAEAAYWRSVWYETRPNPRAEDSANP